MSYFSRFRRLRRWIPASVRRVLKTQRSAVILHGVEVVYSLLLLAWFFAPLFISARGGLVPPLLPLSFLDVAHGEIVGFLIVTCIAYPIPLFCLVKIASVFLERRAPSIGDPTRLVPIVLNALCSGLAIAVLMVQLVVFASGPAWFHTLPRIAYIVFFFSIAWNAFSLAHIMSVVNRSDPAFQELLEYRRKESARLRGPFKILRRRGIQRRIGLTVLPFVLAIVIVPALVMLRDFKRTSFASSVAHGKALAESTANMVRANASVPGALASYLSAEGRRNRESDSPFLTISYVEREARTGVLEVVASTDRSRIGKRPPTKGPMVVAAGYRTTADEDLFEFISPVYLDGARPGYVSVEMARDVIYEPYFRMMVKVLLTAAVSAYAAIFLLFLFGRSIVFPAAALAVDVLPHATGGPFKSPTTGVCNA